MKTGKDDEEDKRSHSSNKKNKSSTKVVKDKSFLSTEKTKVESSDSIVMTKQGLTNLDVFLSQKEDTGNCAKLNISENSIEKIDDLSKHNFLKELIELHACKNIISVFNVTNLRLLTFLDLSDNLFTEIPSLSGFPELKMLNLKNNQIKVCIGKEFKENKMLECFDISNNKIDKVTEKHNVTVFCKHISKLEFLIKFYCAKNKVFDDPKSLKLMLETLKGIKINPQEKFEIIIREDARMKSGVHYSESLSEMCSLIEAVSSFPLKAQKYLQRIIEISNKIKESSGELKEGGDKDKNNDLIETFIQTCQLIGETETNCQENIVTILVNLGHITANDFGSKCFCALQDLMSSSKNGGIYDICVSIFFTNF